MVNLADYIVTNDLSLAQTLPSRWYTAPEFLPLETEKLFWRTWQPIGRTELVARPGDFFTGELVGEPLVITRGKDNQLRAFFNVCQHRAGPVAKGRGNRKSLQCAYHGWTYDLSGQLLHAPEFDGVQDWQKEAVCLKPVAVTTWGPFVFVNLNPNCLPFDHYYGQIKEEVKAAGFRIEQMSRVERRDYLINCNWKVYVDNYLEGYHIPIAHPELFRALDYDAYRVDTFRYHSCQYAPFFPLSEEQPRERDRRIMRSENEAQALYYWVFPNVMLNIYPDNMNINIILPLGHDQTLTIFEWYFEQPGTGPGWESMQQAIAFSDRIQQEDIEICETVQKGLTSRAYNQGRLSLARENGVHHFHQLLAEFLHKG